MLSFLIWIVIGLVILGLEAVIPGTIIMWFGFGGLLTGLFVWIGVLKNAVAQWLFFFISSFLFLIGWIFFFKKILKKEDVRDLTLSELSGVVTKEIKPDIPGEVELYRSFHGLKKWAAESSEFLPEKTEIRVKEAKGISLVVEKK